MSEDIRTRDKWDRAARSMDLMAGFGPERRWKPAKQSVFKHMRADGKILFLALGTGLDIVCFPPGCNITAIDISPKMLEHAAPKVATYDGQITAELMDLHDMSYPDDHFDQVFTSCTFCSVPDPVKGLKALYRVLKPGGRLILYCPDEQRYRKHCRETGQSYNANHQQPDFSLAFVKAILQRLGCTQIIHENAHVETYSWELVCEKVHPSTGTGDRAS